jgi:heme/copper-type cytochrome/quinol oxidase subunit 1
VVLPSLPLVPMPRRYVDYPDAFFWKTVMSNAGLALWFTGAALVLAALLLYFLKRLGR